MLASGLFAIFGADLVIPDGQIDHRGYGQGVAVVGLVVGSSIAIGIGMLVSHVVARVSRR